MDDYVGKNPSPFVSHPVTALIYIHIVKKKKNDKVTKTTELGNLTKLENNYELNCDQNQIKT
jgi:hypothetical protein